MRTLTIGLFLLLLTSVTPRAAAQGFPIELSLTMDRGAYEPGAAISFTIAARNVTREPVALAFGSTLRFDVVIRRDAVVVSRYSDIQFGSPGFGTQRWEPGETVVFGGAWTPFTTLGPSVAPSTIPQPLAPSMYAIAAELLNTGVRITSPPQPLIIGRPTPIGPGCTSLTTSFRVTLPAAAVAAIVVPPSALRGMWRLDLTLGRFTGYLPEADAPRDLTVVPAGEVVLFCTSTAAQALLPDP